METASILGVSVAFLEAVFLGCVSTLLDFASFVDVAFEPSFRVVTGVLVIFEPVFGVFISPFDNFEAFGVVFGVSDTSIFVDLDLLPMFAAGVFGAVDGVVVADFGVLELFPSEVFLAVTGVAASVVGTDVLAGEDSSSCLRFFPFFNVTSGVAVRLSSEYFLFI